MRTLLSVSPKGPKFRRNEISSGKIGLGGKIGGPLGMIGLAARGKRVHESDFNSTYIGTTV